MKKQFQFCCLLTLSTFTFLDSASRIILNSSPFSPLSPSSCALYFSSQAFTVAMIFPNFPLCPQHSSVVLFCISLHSTSCMDSLLSTRCLVLKSDTTSCKDSSSASSLSQLQNILPHLSFIQACFIQYTFRLLFLKHISGHVKPKLITLLSSILIKTNTIA